MGHMQFNAIGAGPFDPFRGRRRRTACWISSITWSEGSRPRE